MRWDDPDWRRGYRKWMATAVELANLLFMADSIARPGAPGGEPLSVGCRPSRLRVDASPGCRTGEAGNKLMTSMMDIANRVIAQPAKQGAAPTLYAADHARRAGR